MTTSYPRPHLFCILPLASSWVTFLRKAQAAPDGRRLACACHGVQILRTFTLSFPSSQRSVFFLAKPTFDFYWCMHSLWCGVRRGRKRRKLRRSRGKGRCAPVNRCEGLRCSIDELSCVHSWGIFRCCPVAMPFFRCWELSTFNYIVRENGVDCVRTDPTHTSSRTLSA